MMDWKRIVGGTLAAIAATTAVGMGLGPAANAAAPAQQESRVAAPGGVQQFPCPLTGGRDYARTTYTVVTKFSECYSGHGTLNLNETQVDKFDSGAYSGYLVFANGKQDKFGPHQVHDYGSATIRTLHLN